MLHHVKAKALVDKFAATLAEMKAQTVGKTLSDVVPQALVETEAVAVPEKVRKTIKDTLTFRL